MRRGSVFRRWDRQPDNVLVGKDGRARVADFGLARDESGELVPPISAVLESSPSLLASPITVAGAILGTPAYMSPEQHRGLPADSRSDQFSFCAALYEALYRQRPFAGETFAELQKQVLAGALRVPHNTELPPQVFEALARGLAVDPAQRFPSMRELLAAIGLDLERDPAALTARSRRSFFGPVLLMLVCAGTLIRVLTTSTALTVGHMLAAGGLLLLGTVLIALRVRNSMMRNEFHRGLVGLMLVFGSQIVAVRGVAFAVGLRVEQLVPIDLVLLAASAALLALRGLTPLWGMVGMVACASLATVVWPASSAQVAKFAYPIGGVLLLLTWNWSSKRRVAR